MPEYICLICKEKKIPTVCRYDTRTYDDAICSHFRHSKHSKCKNSQPFNDIFICYDCIEKRKNIEYKYFVECKECYNYICFDCSKFYNQLCYGCCVELHDFELRMVERNKNMM